jgi:hypothetical protein
MRLELEDFQGSIKNKVDGVLKKLKGSFSHYINTRLCAMTGGYFEEFTDVDVYPFSTIYYWHNYRRKLCIEGY